MDYKERLNLLVGTVSNSKLNDEEFSMIYGVLELSKDRNSFIQQYNSRIDEIIKKKGMDEIE